MNLSGHADGDGKVRNWGFISYENPADRWTRSQVLALLTRHQVWLTMREKRERNNVDPFIDPMLAAFPDIKHPRIFAKLVAQRLSRSIVDKSKWYVIKVDLIGSDLTRTVKVSGGSSLFTLGDKILLPAIGWMRMYHSFVFTELTLGTVFGLPHSDQSSDKATPVGSVVGQLFTAVHGIGLLDFRDWSLAHLLHVATRGGSSPEIGVKIEWIYDLGARWTHEITILERQDDSPSQRVEVLSGEMPAPFEDANGLPCDNSACVVGIAPHCPPGSEYATMVIDGLNLGPSSGELFGEMMRKGETLENEGEIYDPNGFSLSTANDRVQRALSTRLSHPGGGGFACASKSCPECLEFSERAGRDPRLQDLCALCGRFNDHLKVCSECRSVRYCSQECQIKSWKLFHKRECRQLKAGKKKERKN